MDILNRPSSDDNRNYSIETREIDKPLTNREMYTDL